MRLRLDLDTDTATALVRAAVEDRRPVDMEVEVLLRRALGLTTSRLTEAVQANPERPA